MEKTLPRTNDGKFMPGICYSPDTTFKPGHLSERKGMKFPGTGNAGSFAKGFEPHNTLTDGQIRTRTTNEGRTYNYIRIAKGKWEFLQKWRWTNEVGPIGKGMVLRCKTTDTLNCDPSNWELITKAENASRNCRTTKTQLVCTICGNSFEAIRKSVRTCSDECRKQYNLQ